MDANAADKLQVALGGGLVTTPFWVLIFQDVSLVASTVAAICGAVIGLNAVWRLIHRRRASP